jgi:hypothetical protein
MKMYLLLLFVLGGVVSCNDASEKATASAIQHEATTAKSDKKEGASLNSNAKWNADSSTNKNVSQLQQKADELNKDEKKTTSHYHHISNEIQEGINQLVKECKMKGPDHDALHLWLEPLMGEIKELKTVTTTDTGDRLFYSIRTRLADYNLYFE